MKTQNLNGNRLKKYITLLSVTAVMLLSACGGDVFQRLTGGVLVRVELAPLNETIATGTSTQFTATAIYSGNRKEDVTSASQWSSGNIYTATVSDTGLVSGIAPGTTSITATYNGVSGSTQLTVTDAYLVSIEITPPNPVKAKGTTQQFTATGVFSDNSTQDLSSQVTWSSSNTSVSAFVSTGLASADSVGTSTISAAFNGITGTTLMVVTDPELVSISITPPNPGRAMGTTVQFTATGVYSDGTTQNLTSIATWSCSDETIATVSSQNGSRGLATALNNGILTDATVTITATFGTVSGTTNFTVTDATLESITVTPVNTSIPKGLTRQFTAMGIYSDGSSQDITALATWSSANTGLVTISNAAGTTGIATAGNVGSDVIITASLDGVENTTKLSVTAAELVSITVNTSPTTFVTSIAQGLTQEFTATGIYTDGTSLDLTESVTWSASNSNVVISNAAGTRGHGYAAIVGPSVITAESGTISGSYNFTVSAKELISIGVTPINLTIAKGTNLQFTAMGHYTFGADADITTAVTWGPVTGTVATLSNDAISKGLATSGTTTGTINVTATLDGITGNTPLTVTDAALVSIEVTTLDPSVANGNTSQFKATGIYSDATQQILTESATWTIQPGGTGSATVSDTSGTKGLVTATGVGTVTVVAAFGGKSSSLTPNFTVTTAELLSIEVNPTNPSKPKGTYQQFTATGIYTDGPHPLTLVATWESLSTDYATIDSSGYAFAKAVGNSTIRATYGGMSGETTFTVSGATLVSISVESDAVTMPINRTKQFKATGTYTDGTTGNITSDVNWTSTNTAVAQISTAAGTKGIVTSIAAGTTSIAAVHPGYSLVVPGTKSLEVTAAALTLITITPVNPSLANGLTRQFKATGIYDDSTTQDLTNSVTWVSLDSACASINPTNGLATALSEGSTNITATYPGYTGPAASTVLAVTGATLTAISITPATKSIANGTTQQFTALGIFSDSTTQDITSTVTWSSSSLSIATISNDAGSKGLATSVSSGTTTITAALSSISDTASLTVTSATLQSITITPSGAFTIGYGTYQQFTATGLYSNGSTQDITSQVTWSSSTPAYATISNDLIDKGRAMSVSEGVTYINASSGTVTTDPDRRATLTVKALALSSITVTPSNASFGINQTQQMVATGYYNDGTTQDLTTQVVWSTNKPATAIVSNAAGSQGLVTGVSGPDTAIISVTRDFINYYTAVVTITPDTVSPTVTSAILTSTTKVKVTYSEPVEVSSATTPSNYKIALNSSLPESGCTVFPLDSFFTGTTNLLTIFSVAILSPTEFELTISSGLSVSTYAVVVSNAVKDTAGNNLGCPSSASFAGIDTTKPYLVSISNSDPQKLQVVFSEPMLRDGTTYAANNYNNYTLSKVTTGESSVLPTITGVDTISSNTFVLNLSGVVYPIIYKLQVASNVLDEAVPTANTMGTPSYLTFTGNELLKVVSAEALSTTSVRITFNKPVNAGNNTAGSAGCNDTDECAKRYKFNPSLGSISSAVVGTAEGFKNTVTITHSTAQTGQAYTVMAANWPGSGSDTDGFDNSSWGAIQSAASSTDIVKPAPQDRASFVGLGTFVEDFEDGAVFTDPFVDNTSFSYAFTFSGKVYLGTNTTNTSAFRFDPNGSNSVQTTFGFSNVTGACASSTGFGYITGLVTTIPVCGTDINCGPRAEVGVVGFNSITVVPDGSVSSELLMVGPLKQGITDVYYTQDLDLQLDWKNAALATPINAGTNIKSAQTIYGTDKFAFVGISSSHATFQPVFYRFTATAAVSGGPVTLEGSCDMSGNTITYIGAKGTVKNTAPIIGIDSIIKYGTNLYIGNNGGLVRSANYSAACGSVTWTNSTPSAADYTSAPTLVIPASSDTDGGGLGKIRPGDKGIAQFLEYGGKLYMARNVGTGTNNQENLRGELWVCSPTAGVCGPGDWTRILSSGTGSLANAKAISMLQKTKSDVIYIGFDDDTNGARIYRMNCSIPGAVENYSGTDLTATCSGTTQTDTSWKLQGTAGPGIVDSNIKYIYSNASIADGTTSYIYVVVGDGANAVKVFRQID